MTDADGLPQEIDPDDIASYSAPRAHAVPARANTIGMWLFLLSLALLFASGMLIYVLLRVRAPGMPELGAVRDQMADWKLFVSTAVVLLASFTIHLSLKAIQRERQAAFRRWLWITNGLATLFVLVQIPAMISLLSRDPDVGSALQQTAGARPDRLWAVLFFFVLIHALHVVGGIVYLIVVTVRAYRDAYDHESHIGVRHAALYWHFLDVVWLLMFGTFVAFG